MFENLLSVINPAGGGGLLPIALGGGAAIIAVAGLVAAVLARRGSPEDAPASDARPASPTADALLLILALEGDESGDAGLRLVDAATRRLGGRLEVMRASVNPLKASRREEEAARRARAQAEKSRAALTIWGAVEGGTLRLRLLAAGAPAPEAYSLPAELPAPFDAALAALAASVSLQSKPLPDLTPALTVIVSELSAMLGEGPPLEGDAAARMRATLARASLALHARERHPDWARAALEATAQADPRWTTEPLEWAETQAMRGQALTLKLARQAEPSRAELAERVTACRAAYDVWTDAEVVGRLPRAEAELAQSLIELADRDGDLRHVEEAERLAEAAIARKAPKADDPDGIALAAILGAARLRLGEREPKPARLEAAERELRAALVLAEAAGDRGRAARVKIELGRALARLGERDRGSERLRAAAVIFRVCLTENGGDGLAGAQARAALGRTLVHIGERDRDAGVVDEAVGALRMASHAFAATGAAAAAAQARRALERAERLHATLRAARA